MRFSRWKLLLPLGRAIAATALVSTSLAASRRGFASRPTARARSARTTRMTSAAPRRHSPERGRQAEEQAKPSAGMTGIKVGGTSVKIVGYGCGDDTAPTAIKETRRLMEAKADVMVGPLSGDEAVAIANYAKGKPTKTFIIGTAASQDPTMQIAPKNVFRYHGDGAQWNAGLGEIVYKRLGWRNAAIIMDDYSFMDVCGGHHRRLLRHRRQDHEACVPPLNTTDYASYVQQLRSPTRSTGTSGSSAALARGEPEGDGAGERQDRPEAACRQPVPHRRGRRHGSGAAVRRRVRRRVRLRSV